MNKSVFVCMHDQAYRQRENANIIVFTYLVKVLKAYYTIKGQYTVKTHIAGIVNTQKPDQNMRGESGQRQNDNINILLLLFYDRQ